jgi:hypothetical protein
VTPLELALISPVAALVGVALGTVGSGYLERSRDRRAALRQRDQAITEPLTATVDLITGVQAVRVAYQQETRWRHYIRTAAVLLAATGSIMTSGETLSLEMLRDWRRMSPWLDRMLATDRDLDEKQRTIALDMTTIVLPRITRFYAAVVVLMLGPDKGIADAVRDLAAAVGAFSEAIGAKEKRYAQVRVQVEKTLGALRSVADQRRR